MDNVKKVKSDTLNQPAKRPPVTGFDLTKATMELNYQPKSLESTLDLL
jgi:dTDP-4-dehydrorhamnose reductase